jgi:hypothetical protein
MEELDLDIHHYSYTDLLELLKLPTEYTEQDLKKAKRIVLNTHPDKSGLNKDVFLFFSQAYKLVYSVYKMVHHKPTLENIHESHSMTLRDLSKRDQEDKLYEQFSKSKDFHKKFNEIFDTLKHKSKMDNEENDGYEEWLKSNTDDMNGSGSAKNIHEMNEYIEQRKRQLRNSRHNDSMVIYNNKLKDVGSGLSSSNSNTYLTTTIQKREEPEYSSNVFDKLKYEDVKKAYTETVVPVTREDYVNRPKYTSIHQYQMHRDRDAIEYASHENMESHQEKYEQFKREEQLHEQEKALELALQVKRNNEYRKYVNAHFLRLTNA